MAFQSVCNGAAAAGIYFHAEVFDMGGRTAGRLIGGFELMVSQ
jgi:hypothetical protein